VLRKLNFGIVLCLTIFAVRADAQSGSDTAIPSQPKSATPPAKNASSIESRVEHFLRDTYAWGPSFDVKVGPAKLSPIPSLLEVPVTVAKGEQSDTATVYVDKNGKFILRGELADMTVDPFAEIKSKLIPGNSPSIGPENAKVILIEFADFECPSCRQLDQILRKLLAENHQIRLVYKDFPLTNLHPWAMTASIAGQCAYQQRPEAFWEIHNAIFDAQDVISASNVWDKMLDLANKQDLDMNKFRACMADPAMARQVEQTQAEGKSLGVTATPTTFVNGRKIVGAEDSIVSQFISYY